MAIINFLCPKCHALLPANTLNGEQSKHSAFSVPVEIAQPLIGDRVACEQCFESFVVQPDEIKFVVLRLVSED